MAVDTKSIRAKVRAELEAQLKARETAALGVARAWARVTAAQAKVTAAEEATAQALTKATKDSGLKLTEIADLTGIPVAELRRITRDHTDTEQPAQHEDSPTSPEPGHE